MSLLPKLSNQPQLLQTGGEKEMELECNGVVISKSWDSLRLFMHCPFVTFIYLVYPALVLCYAGQAAYISRNMGSSEDVIHLSESVQNRYVHHVFTVLSLFASAAVGSQATITGTFSIINQCQALGCFPRVKVIHTSDKIHGHVYVPDANWVLMLLSLAVTIGMHNYAGSVEMYGYLDSVGSGPVEALAEVKTQQCQVY